MSTKVLFCGGSHLAHAKEIVDSIDPNSIELESQYVVTAGVGTRKQLLLGKSFEYSELKGVVPPASKLNTLTSFFPDEYQLIVIVGNYFLPTRLSSYIKKWADQPMTGSLLEEIIFNSFSDIPYHSEPYSFRSNFMGLLSGCTSTRVMLIPDPRPVDERIDPEIISRYYKCLSRYSTSLGFEYIEHPSDTVSPITGIGNAKYLRDVGNDRIHMNKEYWSKQMFPVIREMSQLS